MNVQGIKRATLASAGLGLLTAALVAPNPANAASLPGSPLSVRATPKNAVVSVGWVAPTSGDPATSYEVLPYRVTAAGATPLPERACVTAAHSCTVDGLVNGKRYVFAVAAVNATGRSAWPSLTSVVAPRTKPTAPRSVRAKEISGAWTKISWKAPRSNGGDSIDRYRVLASRDGGKFRVVPCRSVDGPILKARACKVGLAGGPLRFRVQAHNDAGWSTASKSSNKVSVPVSAQ